MVNRLTDQYNSDKRNYLQSDEQKKYLLDLIEVNHKGDAPANPVPDYKFKLENEYN